MKHIAGLVLAFLCLSAAITTANAQQYHEVFRVGNWIGVRYVNAAGNLDRCSAVAEYGNKVVLALTRWASGDVGLKISDLDWQLSRNVYELGLMIDNRYIGSVGADKEERYKLAINLGRDSAVSNLLSRGNVLYIRASEIGAYSLPLVKSAAAIAELRRCTLAANYTGGPKEPPPSSPPVVIHNPPPNGGYQERSYTPLSQAPLNVEMNPCAFGVAVSSCSTP